MWLTPLLAFLPFRYLLPFFYLVCGALLQYGKWFDDWRWFGINPFLARDLLQFVLAAVMLGAVHYFHRAPIAGRGGAAGSSEDASRADWPE